MHIDDQFELDQSAPLPDNDKATQTELTIYDVLKEQNVQNQMVLKSVQSSGNKVAKLERVLCPEEVKLILPLTEEPGKKRWLYSSVIK